MIEARPGAVRETREAPSCRTRGDLRAYAVPAIPWALLAVGVALLWVLLSLVRQEAWTLWPLQGVAVGVVAALVGWSLDEPAAAVVDAAPRGLAWRTGVRLAAVAIILAGWTSAVLFARAALFGHPWSVWLQGIVMAAIGCAWVCWRRTRGEATPGARWALTVLPIATAWALVRPFDQHFPVFPYGAVGAGADWASSTWGWSVAGVVAIGCTVVVLARKN